MSELTPSIKKTDCDLKSPEIIKIADYFFYGPKLHSEISEPIPEPLSKPETTNYKEDALESINRRPSSEYKIPDFMTPFS
ncbi:15293_t:CDS:2 [Entrophospora sp. SA101]|nr:15293_t:CDS:2 [Entrophospora sp. SA101]